MVGFKGDGFVEGVVPRLYRLFGECENEVDVDVFKAGFAGEAITLKEFGNGVDSA